MNEYMMRMIAVATGPNDVFDNTPIPDPLPNPNAAVQGIVNFVIATIGAVAVAFIIYGGIQYSMSAGDSSKVTKAKNTILYAVIGLIVAVMAFAIVNFVIAGMQTP